MRKVKKISIILSLLMVSAYFSEAIALPIDWHGSFGLDATRIGDFRKIKETSETVTIGDLGSQEVGLAAGDKETASFQGYLLKLNPVMLINDSATFKGEITTGYARGGRLGDSSTTNKDASMGNALYSHNISNQNGNLTMNKFYMELYADTATYILGRHSIDWALGAMFNSGAKMWDRHSYTRDGVTAKIRLGNFLISPFYAKLGSNNSLTDTTNVKDYGCSLLYDNPERDMAFGLLYSVKKNGANNQDFSIDIDGTGAQELGATEVKMMDFYFKQAFGKFEFMLEAPIISGNIGYLYDADKKTNYKGRAIILESKYSVTDSWVVGVNGGTVNGESGATSSYDAIFLNPNYQIAELLFRYNMMAVSDDTISVYDSYITNAKYLKFYSQYSAEQWTWNVAVIYAKADEVAAKDDWAYNHMKNKRFYANESQADDLGLEFDFGFNYQWNREISISGSFGYLFTGDYYSFTNSSTTNTAEDSYILQLKTAINF